MKKKRELWIQIPNRNFCKKFCYIQPFFVSVQCWVNPFDFPILSFISFCLILCVKSNVMFFVQLFTVKFVQCQKKCIYVKFLSFEINSFCAINICPSLKYICICFLYVNSWVTPPLPLFLYIFFLLLFFLFPFLQSYSVDYYLGWQYSRLC